MADGAQQAQPWGREAQTFATIGLVAGILGALWDRAAGPAFTLAERVDDVLRRSLPGLLAVAIGLAVWSAAGGWPSRAAGLALKVVVCAATTLAAVVVGGLVEVVRAFLQRSAVAGESRWELPLRLAIAGFALGTLAELLVDLVRRLSSHDTDRPPGT